MNGIRLWPPSLFRTSVSRAAANCAPLLPRLERTHPADLALPLPAVPFLSSREQATPFPTTGPLHHFPRPLEVL